MRQIEEQLRETRKLDRMESVEEENSQLLRGLSFLEDRIIALEKVFLYNRGKKTHILGGGSGALSFCSL